MARAAPARGLAELFLITYFALLYLSNITLKRLPTILEELNETIFQMKDAKYFSFKELQLNMDN